MHQMNSFKCQIYSWHQLPQPSWVKAHSLKAIPLSLGSIGMHGNPAANRLMGEADVLLAVGTRFSDRATANLDTFAPNAKKIHIDIDAAEIGKNIEVDVPIVGDAKIALKMLHDCNDQRNCRKTKAKTWTKRVKEAKEQLSPLLKDMTQRPGTQSVTNRTKKTAAERRHSHHRSRTKPNVVSTILQSTKTTNIHQLRRT